MNVLHIGHSVKWRGGENQARLLIETAIKIEPKCRHFLAYPNGATIFERLAGKSAGNLALYSGKAFDVRSILALIRFCKAERITILHAHSATAHTLAVVVKTVLPGLKLIVHRRVDNPIKTRKSTRYKYLTDKVDKFISVSSAIETILIRYGVPSNKVALIYDSIDATVYTRQDKAIVKATFVAQKGLCETTPLIGFISAMSSQKRPELFVEIIKGVLDRGISVNALMAGDGKLMEDVRAKIERYGLTSDIRLMGFVEDVAAVFPALDIFILPSRNEGLGTVMLEAIAAGTVVVASDVGGIGEVIIDQQTGRLIPGGQVERYVDAVIELVENHDLRVSLAIGAKHHVTGRFDLDKMVKSTLNLYRSLS